LRSGLLSTAPTCSTYRTALTLLRLGQRLRSGLLRTAVLLLRLGPLPCSALALPLHGGRVLQLCSDSPPRVGKAIWNCPMPLTAALALAPATPPAALVLRTAQDCACAGPACAATPWAALRLPWPRLPCYAKGRNAALQAPRWHGQGWGSHNPVPCLVGLLLAPLALAQLALRTALALAPLALAPCPSSKNSRARTVATNCKQPPPL
jgi:hypothetical protein